MNVTTIIPEASSAVYYSLINNAANDSTSSFYEAIYALTTWQFPGSTCEAMQSSTDGSFVILQPISFFINIVSLVLLVHGCVKYRFNWSVSLFFASTTAMEGIHTLAHMMALPHNMTAALHYSGVCATLCLAQFASGV